jgi:hypothetical protein
MGEFVGFSLDESVSEGAGSDHQDQMDFHSQ